MPVGKWFALRDSNFRRSSSYVSILLIRRNLRTVRLFCGTNVGPNFAQDKRTGRVITSSAILCLCWNQLSQMEILPRLTSIASSKSFSLPQSLHRSPFHSSTCHSSLPEKPNFAPIAASTRLPDSPTATKKSWFAPVGFCLPFPILYVEAENSGRWGRFRQGL